LSKEGALNKKAYTFDHQGEIIMIRKPNPDVMQNLSFEPKVIQKRAVS